MKINTKILLLLMITLDVQAEELAFEHSGNLRFGLQYHDSETSGSDIAVGGDIHTEIKPTEAVRFATTFYTTQALFEKDDAFGIAFFGDKGEAYSILSEAYMKLSYAKSTLIAGRQILDTPFLDSDDIGMIPNSFEAYTLLNHSLEETTLLYSFVRQMSGVDADIPQKFSDINGKSGVHTFGLSYEGIEDVSLSGWVYAMPHFATISYGELIYSGAYDGFLYTLSGQGALQDFKVGEGAKVFGIATTLGHESSDFTLQIAYDKALDAGAINGFGGGPYFVNCEHMTLEDVGKDGDILVYGLEWDASSVIAEG
jgi:hypothetical protein